MMGLFHRMTGAKSSAKEKDKPTRRVFPSDTAQHPDLDPSTVSKGLGADSQARRASADFPIQKSPPKSRRMSLEGFGSSLVPAFNSFPAEDEEYHHREGSPQPEKPQTLASRFRLRRSASPHTPPLPPGSPSDASNLELLRCRRLSSLYNNDSSPVTAPTTLHIAAETASPASKPDHYWADVEQPEEGSPVRRQRAISTPEMRSPRLPQPQPQQQQQSQAGFQPKGILSSKATQAWTPRQEYRPNPAVTQRTPLANGHTDTDGQMVGGEQALSARSGMSRGSVWAVSGRGGQAKESFVPRTPDLAESELPGVSHSAKKSSQEVQAVPASSSAFWDMSSSLTRPSALRSGKGSASDSFHWQRPQSANPTRRLTFADDAQDAQLSKSAKRSIGESMWGAKGREASKPRGKDVDGPPREYTRALQNGESLADGRSRSVTRERPWPGREASPDQREWEKEGLRHMISALQADVAAMEAEAAAFVDERAVWEMERGAMGDEIDMRTSQVQSVGAERDELAEQVDELRRQLDAALEVPVSSVSAHIDRADYTGFIDEIDHLRAELETEHGALAEAQELREAAEQRYESLRSSYAGLEQLLCDAQGSTRQQKQRCQELQNTVEGLEAELSQRQEEKSTGSDPDVESRELLAVANSQLTHRVVELSDNLSQTLDVAQKAMTEKAALTTQVQRLRKELAAAEENGGRLAQVEGLAEEALAALEKQTLEGTRLRGELALMQQSHSAAMSLTDGELGDLREAVAQAKTLASAQAGSAAELGAATEQIRTLRAEVGRQAAILREVEDSKRSCQSCQAREVELTALREAVRRNAGAAGELRRLQEDLAQDGFVPAAQAEDLQAQLKEMHRILQLQLPQSGSSTVSVISDS